MAEAKVAYDYSGRPLRPFDELDREDDTPRAYGRGQLETKDDRYAEKIRGRWYLVDDDWQPMKDSPVDADQIA